MAAVQDLLGGEPSDAEDGPATAQRLKRPRFTRAEAEINGTYVFSHMSLQAGDDLLQWACNEAFRYRDVRYGSMRSLSKAIRSTYAPGNVLSTNFHEPLDGHQYLWMHRRLLLDTLVTTMVSDPKFAGVHINIKLRCAQSSAVTSESTRRQTAASPGFMTEQVCTKAL